jgi:hypothetical protein
MNSVEAILNPTDMEISRTPRELCDWVDSRASLLSETDEGKHYARSGARLPKKLWEEIRPLGLFALLSFGSKKGIKCTPNLTNDNYDGKIDFDNSAIPSIYVEITYAKDGEDERLRLGVLNAKGSVNALGRISKSGTKASGRQTVAIENEAVKHEEVRNKALEFVKQRILKKSGKTYGPNHVLVIVIDDYLPFRTEDDKAVLVEFVKPIIESLKLDIKAAFLLGSSGNYLSCIHGKI